MIFKKVGYESYTGLQDATLKVEIFVPINQVGRIIGKGGQTVSCSHFFNKIVALVRVVRKN